MAASLLRSWGLIRRDPRGSVAIEFALVGGIAVLMVVAILQVGFYFYVSASLENATSRAMRQVMTGAVGAGSLTAAQFRTSVLCPLLPAAMSCNNIITNLQTVSEGAAPNGFYQFVNASQSWVVPPTMNNVQTTFCTGSAGTVVYAQVYYAMPIIVPALLGSVSTSWNGQSVYFVGSYAAFKNEPFQGNAGTC